MPAADAGGDGPEKRLWQRNTMPTINKISAAMHATTMPIIAPVDKDLEGLAAGADDGVDDGAGDGADDGVDDGADDGAGDEADDGNVLETAINLSTLMDPSPVMGSHPVVG